MKNQIVSIMAAGIIIVSAFSVASADRPSLFPKCGGVYNKCGYVNRNTKKLIFPYVYEKTRYFSEGLAAVQLDGKFGYIDVTGKITIKSLFKQAGRFGQGLAPVLLDGKVGVINRAGKIVVKPQFRKAVPFTRNVVLVQTMGDLKKVTAYQAGLVRRILSIERRPFKLFHIKYGWIDQKNYAFSTFEDNGRGLIWAKSKETNGLYGLLRADGQWHVKPQFSKVGGLMNGRAVVSWVTKRAFTSGLSRKIKNSGVVDENGKLVVYSEFNWIGQLKNGYFLVGNSGVRGPRGLLSKDGDLLGGRLFDAVEHPTNRHHARVKLNGKWYSLTKDGKLEKDELDGEIIHACSSGLKLQRRGNKIAILDRDGKQHIPYLFDSAGYINLNYLNLKKVLNKNCSWPMFAQLNGKIGYISKSAKLIFGPPNFESSSSFKNGVGGVKSNGKWGIVNEKGGYIVQPVFEKLRRRNSDTFEVVQNSRTFWVNLEGREVVKPKPSLKERAKYLSCYNDSNLFQDNGLWGIKSNSGKIIIEPKYRALLCFRNGIAWAAIESRKLWCPLGPDGKITQITKCEKFRATAQRSHSAQIQLDDDLYESSVQWNRAYRDFGLGKIDELPKMRRTNLF